MRNFSFQLTAEVQRLRRDLRVLRASVVNILTHYVWRPPCQPSTPTASTCL